MSEFMMQKYLEINNWIESLKREEGQTLAEYALLLALIAIVVIMRCVGRVQTILEGCLRQNQCRDRRRLNPDPTV